MRCAFLLAAALLASCSFGSTSAFFNDDDSARPFAHGAEFIMSEHPAPGPNEEMITVTVFWRDGVYDLIGANNAEWVDVRFVAISGTPEEDYIVQLPVARDGSTWAYAFIWQSDGQYKAVVAPGLIEDADGSQLLGEFCHLSRAGSCVFNSRETLYAFYEQVFYPRFVQPDSDLNGLLYWTPMNSNESRSNE